MCAQWLLTENSWMTLLKIFDLRIYKNLPRHSNFHLEFTVFTRRLNPIVVQLLGCREQQTTWGIKFGSGKHTMIVTQLIAELHNTVCSCSQHSVAAFRLTYECPGIQKQYSIGCISIYKACCCMCNGYFQHSPPSSAKFKERSSTSASPCAAMAWTSVSICLSHYWICWWLKTLEWESLNCYVWTCMYSDSHVCWYVRAYTYI